MGIVDDLSRLRVGRAEPSSLRSDYKGHVYVSEEQLLHLHQRLNRIENVLSRLLTLLDPPKESK